MREPILNPTEQPAGDIIVARITEVGEEGDLGTPHAWREQRTSTSGLYVDGELGRRGTTSIEPAYTLSGSSAAVDDLVFLRLRSWTVRGRVYDIVANAGSSGAQFAVVPQGYVSAQERGSGCGAGGAGDQCIPTYHHGVVQVWDSTCQLWTDVGCGWIIEVLGRKLETDRRYLATRIGTAPTYLEAVIIDPSSGACTPASGASLYAVDRGKTTESIVVGNRIGRLCASSGSGDDDSVSLGDLSDNLIWFYGVSYVWDETACGWVVLEDLIIASPLGCTLRTGERITGHFNKMIPTSTIEAAGGSGGGDGTCLPSFLAVVERKSGTYSVTCCPGGGFLIVSYTDACGRVHVEDCNCDSGSGSGGGTVCTMSPVPECYSGTMSGVTNSACLTCSGFNRTYTLCLNEAGDEWEETVGSPVCIGVGGLTYSLNCQTIDGLLYMVFDNGVSQYRKLVSEWVAFGANIMDLYTSTGHCNMPPTFTLSPA